MVTEFSKYNAGPSLAGYLFQCRLALLVGLQMAKKKPNGHISIEKFDDITFHDEDLSLCLLQSKHTVTPKSLSDVGADVWKTLGIWMEHLEKGIIPFSSTRFVLITTSSAPPDSAMAFLRIGTSSDDRQKCLQKLREVAAKSKSQGTSVARERFLSLSDEQAQTLLNQIDVLDSHPNLVDVMEDIEGELILVAPGHASGAAAYLEGWWLGVVARTLLDDTSAPISVQQIIRKASEIGRSFGEDSLPLDDPDKLGAKGYSCDDETELFVRQMRLVELPDSVVRRGAQDYYRAFAQRSKWARERLLLDTELSRFDEKLEDLWGRKRDEELALATISSESDKKSLGCRLCLWAAQQSFPLRNVVETWITAGSYQGLADRLKVGWHPDFRAIFKEESGNEYP